MIDKNMPIRRKDTQIEAVLMTYGLDGTWPLLVRYRGHGGWWSGTYTPAEFETTFENVPPPPPPRRTKVWLRDYPHGFQASLVAPENSNVPAIGSAYVTEGQWADEGDKP